MNKKSQPQDGSTEFEPAECVCLGLRRAARTVTRFYDDVLRPCDLKATQFSLLAILSRNGRTPFSDLTTRLAMDQTTLTRNLRPLERRALIRVTPGTDRRTRDIQLTSAGKSLYRKAEVLWTSAQVHTTSVIGAAKWKRIRVELDGLVGGLVS